MIAVEYRSDLKKLQSDARFSAVFGGNTQPAPFDRPDWWRGLADHCGLAPRLAVASDTRDMAILPLCDAGDGSLAGLSNWYTFRLKPVFSPGADAPALLAAIAADLVGQAGRITLSGVPDEDGSASMLESAFRQAGWIVRREVCDSNHILETRGRDFAAYLAGRPGALRTTLRRKGHRAVCEVLTRFDADAWAVYEDIYAESWKPLEGSPAFLRAFAEQEGAAGRLRLGIARIDGSAAAAQLWTVEGAAAYIHKLAHRPAASAASPGTALTAALMRHVIDTDRVDLVDFGTGDDGYKRDWMESVRRRYSLTMLRPGNPRNWPVFVKSALRRLAGRDKRG